MARPGRAKRNRAAQSFRQLRQFHHVINSDDVFGTHKPPINALHRRAIGVLLGVIAVAAGAAVGSPAGRFAQQRGSPPVIFYQQLLLLLFFPERRLALRFHQR